MSWNKAFDCKSIERAPPSTKLITKMSMKRLGSGNYRIQKQNGCKKKVPELNTVSLKNFNFLYRYNRIFK